MIPKSPIYKDMHLRNKTTLSPIGLLPLLLLALLSGLAAGFGKLGSTVTLFQQLSPNHALLMIGGFLGSLILLERAMGLPHRWRLALPGFNLLSLPLLLCDAWRLAAGVQLLAAAALFVLLYAQTRQYNTYPSLLLALGAFCWVLAQAVLLQTELVAAAVPWWMAFFIFTILGERLELSKFLPTPKWAFGILYGWLALLLIGNLLPFHRQPISLSALALLGMSSWLVYFDMAHRLIRKTGQFKYIGAGLLVGYGWLGAHSLLVLFAPTHAFQYDLQLHTFFLGFVFSMIWAHAPIILPMLFNRLGSPFHPWLWLPWSLFQLSLVARVLAAWHLQAHWRSLAAQINAYSILLLLASMAAILLHKKRPPAS